MPAQAKRIVTKIDANPLLAKQNDENGLLRVAAYCRVSTDSEDQLESYKAQVAYYTDAIAKNPKLLLCDEPTGALDYKTGKQILKLLEDTCRKEQMTVIIITHNGAIAPMADKIIKFKNGGVQEVIKNEKPTPIEEIEW